jgi:hypothetical protein
MRFWCRGRILGEVYCLLRSGNWLPNGVEFSAIGILLQEFLQQAYTTIKIPFHYETKDVLEVN